MWTLQWYLTASIAKCLILQRERKVLCTCTRRVLHCTVLEVDKSCALYRGTVPFLLHHLQVQALFTSSTKAPGTHSFTTTSTLTYILLPTGAGGLFTHSCITFVQSGQSLVFVIGTALFMFVNFIRLFPFLLYASFLSYKYLCILPFRGGGGPR